MSALSILYITYDGIADPIGQSQVAPYLLGLAKMGHRITLVSAEKKDKQDILRRYTQVFREQNIEWHYVRYHKRPPVVSSVWDVYCMQQLTGHLIRRNKATVIHCRGYIPSLIGLHFKKKKGIKCIFDMRDFWVDACKETKRFDLDNNIVHKALYIFFKKKEKEFFQHADQIISLTEAGKRVIQKWVHDGTIQTTAPIAVIPCCADFSFFDSARLDAGRMAAVRRNLGLAPNDFVLSYLGSLSPVDQIPVYLIEEMLDFFKVLLERLPNAKFLIIANNDHQSARDTAIRKGVDAGLLIITQGTKEEMPYLIAQSNLSVSFIMPSFAKQACSPTKLAELLAMNVPVIGNTGVGDLDAILSLAKNNSAVVTRFDKEEYELVRDRVLQRIDDGCISIRDNSMAFSLTAGVKAYDQVYRQLRDS